MCLNCPPFALKHENVKQKTFLARKQWQVFAFANCFPSTTRVIPLPQVFSLYYCDSFVFVPYYAFVVLEILTAIVGHVNQFWLTLILLLTTFWCHTDRHYIVKAVPGSVQFWKHFTFMLHCLMLWSENFCVNKPHIDLKLCCWKLQVH